MTSVEGTNDYSIVSKLSAANQGYFEDEFLAEFVEKPRRRAPLINWGYYLRFKSLEFSFEEAVKRLVDHGKSFQVLSIGAGFDTTYFRLASKYKTNNMTFFEIDLPSNVERKVNLILNSEKCKQYLANVQPITSKPAELRSQSYRLFTADLLNPDQLKSGLQAHGFHFAGDNACTATLIMSECVLTYLPEAGATRFIKQLVDQIQHPAALFVYEQCRPHDGFGRFMVRHFDKIGSPIAACIHRYPDVEQQIQRYKEAGWDNCQVETLFQTMQRLSVNEREELSRLDIFDEFEELIEKSGHYFVLTASKLLPDSPQIVPFANVPQDANKKENEDERVELHVKSCSNDALLQRFGHSVATDSAGHVYLIGGFSDSSEGGPGGRQKTTIRFKIAEDCSHGAAFKTPPIVAEADPRLERLYSAMVWWEEADSFVVTGGRLGPHKPIRECLTLRPTFREGHALNMEIDNISVIDGVVGCRWRHAAARVGNYLVVVGGRGVEQLVHNDVLAVPLTSLKKKDTGCDDVNQVIRAQLPIGLHSCAITTVSDSQAIVSGGMSDVGAISDRLFRIEVLKDRLTVEELSFVLPVGRFSHTSHLYRGRLLLVGGVAGNCSPGVDLLDLEDGTVVVSILPRMGPDSNILMLHNHQTFVEDDSLYIVGGGGNCFSFGTHYNGLWSLDLKSSFRQFL